MGFVKGGLCSPCRSGFGPECRPRPDNGEHEVVTARRRMLERSEKLRDPTVGRRLAFAEVLNDLAGDDKQPAFMPWFFGVE